MFGIEVAEESLKELWELRRKHQKAALALKTTGDTPVTRLLAYVTTEIGKVWEREAPRLTGTLASATREQIFNNVGRVFIDPTVENPVFGGYPAIYGPIVHNRRPWVATLMARDVPNIARRAWKPVVVEFRGAYRV